MGIGIGGGLGPLRGGISTRGAGVGIGPLRAGTSWRGGGSLFALILIAAAVTFVVAWPYMLGQWLAGQMGAAEQSTSQRLLSWTLECAYLAAVGWYLIASAVAERHRREEVEARQAADRLAERQRASAKAKRAQQVSQKTDYLYLRAALETCTAMAELVSDHPGGISSGDLHPKLSCLAVPNSESLLSYLDDVELIEPRVPHPGAAKVPTGVDRGLLIITNDAIRFRGARKSVEWRWDRLQRVIRAPGHREFVMSNRKTVSGIGGDGPQLDVVDGALTWGQTLADGETTGKSAEDFFRDAASRYARKLATSPAKCG